MTITTPDGMRYECEDYSEARAFVSGFCAALYTFGIYRNGVQVIGCQEKPTREYREQMKQQLRDLGGDV